MNEKIPKLIDKNIAKYDELADIARVNKDYHREANYLWAIRALIELKGELK